MEHKTLAATVDVVDQELGAFEALVSAWDADREGDVIAVNAFDKTISAWRESGKNLPLLFEHSSEVVGAIDPASLRPTKDGLVAAGEVDRDADRGEQVWRQIKSGTAGFSIGFMSESEPRPGGGRRLTEIDLLEVSITSTPINAATRALSWKSTGKTDPRVEREFAAIKEALETAGKNAVPVTKSSAPVKIARFEI